MRGSFPWLGDLALRTPYFLFQPLRQGCASLQIIFWSRGTEAVVDGSGKNNCKAAEASYLATAKKNKG